MSPCLRSRTPSVPTRAARRAPEHARSRCCSRRRSFKDDRAGADVDDRERVCVAVRVDADHVVQLICKHPTHLQPRLGDTLRCRSGGEDRKRQDCDGSRPQRADRLLIRPASGRQAGTGLFVRTNHWQDTRSRGHAEIESQTKSTGATLTTAPDGTPADSQFGNVT
jgi:hypothetical protein